jgi:hypothetical protein
VSIKNKNIIMNATEQYKEKIINDYMSLVDLNNKNTLDYKKIEAELTAALGERPAVEFKYEDSVTLNEDGKETKRISNLECINIYYSIQTNSGILFNKMTYNIL